MKSNVNNEIDIGVENKSSVNVKDSNFSNIINKNIDQDDRNVSPILSRKGIIFNSEEINLIHEEEKSLAPEIATSPDKERNVSAEPADIDNNKEEPEKDPEKKTLSPEQERKKLRKSEKAEIDKLENQKLVEKYLKILEEEGDKDEDKSFNLYGEDKNVIKEEQEDDKTKKDDTIIKQDEPAISQKKLNSSIHIASLQHSSIHIAEEIIESNSLVKAEEFKDKIKNYFVEEDDDEDKQPMKPLVIRGTLDEIKKNANLDFLFNTGIMNRLSSEINELLEYNNTHCKQNILPKTEVKSPLNTNQNNFTFNICPREDSDKGNKEFTENLVPHMTKAGNSFETHSNEVKTLENEEVGTSKPYIVNNDESIHSKPVYPSPTLSLTFRERQAKKRNSFVRYYTSTPRPNLISQCAGSCATTCNIF